MLSLFSVCLGIRFNTVGFILMVHIFKHIPLGLCVVNEHVVDWTWIWKTHNPKNNLLKFSNAILDIAFFNVIILNIF